MKVWLVCLFFLIGAGISACQKHGNRDTEKAATAQVYTCPMHLQYTSDKPGDCPICGMRLVLKEETETPPAETHNHGAAVSGQGPVRISPEKENLIGAHVSMVEIRDLAVTVRASARVAYDPALYSAILEYQEAQKAPVKTVEGGESPFKKETDSTIRSSRLRLRQMGLSDDQIDQFSQPGFDPNNYLLGKTGGTVWVYVDIYDFESSLVKSGQSVEFTSPAYPGRTFKGTVRAVDSIVNNETRTLRARVEVANPKGDLKPEMYLSAVIRAGIGKKLSIPESAVMDTGTRQLAYVEKEPGHYEPREIRVGRQADGFYEVLEGLEAGENVVTSANFLIDSESKLRGSR